MEISLHVGQVHIEEDFVNLKVYGDNCGRFYYSSNDSFERKITEYSGTISIPASTVMELTAQVIEELVQRDDSSRTKEALVRVAATALRSVVAATSRALR